MQYRYSFLLIFFLYIDTASAYVGPGLGMGAIGVIIGIIAAILLAILGVIWYPLKRMLRKNVSTEAQSKKSDGS